MYVSTARFLELGLKLRALHMCPARSEPVSTARFLELGLKFFMLLLSLAD